MSVTGDSQVAYRRSSGYANPALPEGLWLGSVTVSGDASGGNISLNLIMSEAVAQLNSRIFSLEQLGLFSVGDTTGRNWVLFTDNLGLDGPAALTNRFTLLTVNTTIGTIVSLDPGSVRMLPLFLGSMRVLSVQTRLGVLSANPGVGFDYRLEAQGYWWGPRSILVDGGPQRPPNGLYPA